MKLAIMQPYFFPYLGYFQLMAAVDRFVVYDDVNFIKGGWINRNRILLRGAPHFITLPLADANANRKINEIRLATRPRWREKMLKTMEQAYRSAPHFDEVLPLLRRVIEFPAERLVDYLFHSLVRLKEFLNLATELQASAGRYANENLKGTARVLDICEREKARTYVNAIGGRELYEASVFHGRGIELRFLESAPHEYRQRGNDFVPGLSIVDVLMFNSEASVRSLLSQYRLSA